MCPPTHACIIHVYTCLPTLKANLRFDIEWTINILEFYHVLVQIRFVTSKEELVIKKISLGNEWLHEMQSNRKKSKLYGSTT